MAGKVYPPGAGDVTITLGGETLTLKTSLQAGIAISRQAGGIRGAVNKIQDMDLDTILTVIRVGVGPKEAKRLSNLDEMVYSSGLMDGQGELLARLIEFCTNVARGGRPAGDDDDEKEGGEPQDPPKPNG